jgi:hypothetical protein
MHAETLALLNSKYEVLSWLHVDIIRIVLKLENPPQNITFNYQMINFPNIYMLGMLLYVI